MNTSTNFCIIAKSATDNGFRTILTNSGWVENPQPDEYAIVPKEMVEEILKTEGFCDIKLNRKGTEVVSFTAREIPVYEPPKVELPISETEQLRADIDYLAIMTGVTL